MTLNEINALALGSWILGIFPPGRLGPSGTRRMAMDNLLAAHVLGYEAIHRSSPDAVVTTNNSSVSLYEFDPLLIDLLLARSMGVDRATISTVGSTDAGSATTPLLPPRTASRRCGSSARRRSPSGWRSPRAETGSGPVVRLTAASRGGRLRQPARAHARRRWARLLRPVGLSALPAAWPSHRRRQDAGSQPGSCGTTPPTRSACTRGWRPSTTLTPGLPLWVVENGLCNRVRNARSYPRLDGWDRTRYLRENIAAVMAAVDAGLPVSGYWHWSLVDNYEWGSYEPRFGLYGLDRHHGAHGAQWLDDRFMGADSAGTYRRIIAGLRQGTARCW